jgi:hypothetical protein
MAGAGRTVPELRLTGALAPARLGTEAAGPAPSKSAASTALKTMDQTE